MAKASLVANPRKDAASGSGKPDDNLLLGVLFIMGFCIFAPFMDATGKYLSAYMPIAQIVWARFAMHTLIALPLVLIYRRKAFLNPSNLPIQLGRSVLLMMATTFFFTGLKYLPMASNLSLAFISPFVVTVFSPFLLGEKVGVRRWTAVIVGFLGVLIMMRPGSELFTPYALLPMACGLVYGFYVLFTRKMAGSDPPLVTLAYTSITAGALMTVWLVITGDWVVPNEPHHWLLLATLGFWAMLSHGCLIRAFDYAPASALSPYMYCEIVMTTLLGLLWFGEFPSLVVWMGVGVIISSGIYISWRERVTARKERAAKIKSQAASVMEERKSRIKS